MNAPVDSNTNEMLRLDAAAIRIAVRLRTELLAKVEAQGAIRIDASAVERIDTATLQVLAAFFRDMRQASRKVEWCGSSPALERAASILGLRAAIGLAAGNI